ncbi:MAG: LptF/LptG family permease [Leptospiraceae bacterium]|nr:LptF/LptG family permease [Leptospiraceae bacterium]
MEFVKDYFPPKLIHRYIFSEFFKTFIGSLIMLTGILLISVLMDNMKTFVASQQKPYHIALFLLYSIPKMLVVVASPSLMFSVCFVVGQFSVNKELVSIMAAGVSFYRSVSTLIFFGFFMWFFIIFFSEFIMRPSNKMAANEQAIILKGIGNKTDLVYQLHIRGAEGFYYVYWYDNEQKKIRGGFNYIKINNENMPELVISANSALYTESTHSWKMEQVEEIIFDDKLSVKSFKTYPEKVYTLPENADYFAKPVKTADQMNFFELNEEIKIRKNKGMPYGELEVERQSIFANPMMCLIVVVIGAISGTFTKRSAGISSLAITIGIVILYYVLFSAFRSLGENGGIPPFIAVWFTPTLFSLICAYMIKKFNL